MTDPGQDPLPEGYVQLGSADIDRICQAAGKYKVVRYPNTFGIRCATSPASADRNQPGDEGMNILAGCIEQYGSDAVSHYTNYNDTDSWFCYGPAPKPDLPDLSPATETCELLPGGRSDGDGLVVNFRINELNPDTPYADYIPVNYTINGVRTESFNPYTEGAYIFVEPLVLSSDYGTTVRVVIEVDPDNTVAEEDETNNVATITTTLPATRPTDQTSLSC